MNPGYKRTEVGIIPEHWNVSCLGAHGATYGGLTGKTKRDFGSGDARYVTFMNVMSNVVIDSERFERVRVGASESQNPVRLGDLIFNGSSETPEEVAFCAVVLKEHSDLYLNSFCFGYRIRNHTAVEPRFVPYLFRSQLGREMVKALAQGSTRYNISKGALLEAPIPLPPLPEQRAIAAALSDIDALLAGLDRLIAKKRDLKQAAMQQLLTGHTRLPGFQGEWEVKRLGEICKIGMGRTPSRLNSALWGRGYVWLSIGDLHSKVVSQSKEQITELAASTMTIVPKGTLLMSFKLSIGRLCFAGCDLFTNEAICSFNDLNAEAEYLYYMLGQTHFSLYGRQAVKGYTLNKESLKLVEVRLPSRSEQTAIATVLSDMDAELAALEARRDKTRALKQGMMQELLSGRTRLV